MVEREFVLTEQGLRKAQEELEYRRTVRRKEITSRIRDALTLGDTWENSEYETAKQEQAFNEGRIQVLESILHNARIIEKGKSKPTQVQPGVTVEIEDTATGERYSYAIVGSTEADPSNHKISHRSPVAQGLMTRKVGDVVRINVPDGTFEVRILGIEWGE